MKFNTLLRRSFFYSCSSFLSWNEIILARLRPPSLFKEHVENLTRLGVVTPVEG